MTVMPFDWWSTALPPQYKRRAMTEARIDIVVLEEQSEPLSILGQHVLTDEMIDQRVSLSSAPDSQFRPWAEVVDALRTRHPR